MPSKPNSYFKYQYIYYNQHHFPLYIPEEFDNGKSFAIIRILLFLSLYLTAPIAKLNANNGVDFIFDMNEALRVSVSHWPAISRLLSCRRQQQKNCVGVTRARGQWPPIMGLNADQGKRTCRWRQSGCECDSIRTSARSAQPADTLVVGSSKAEGN